MQFKLTNLVQTLKIYCAFLTGHDSWVMRCLKHWQKDKNGCWQLENLLRNNWQCTQANTNCCRIANRRRQQAGDGRRCGRRGKERERDREKNYKQQKAANNSINTTISLSLRKSFIFACISFFQSSSLLLTDSFYVGKQNLFTPNPKQCSTMGILALALDNANVCREGGGGAEGEWRSNTRERNSWNWVGNQKKSESTLKVYSMRFFAVLCS